MWIVFEKITLWGNNYVKKLLQGNSGEWHWLGEKPAPLVSLNRSLWRGAVPSLNFYCLLFFSGVIASLGLLANSAATIIGAMIVAPLMGPIIAIAYAMVAGNRRLIRRAIFTLITGIILTIVTSIIISKILGLTTLGSEIMGRVRPNLIDLGVAVAAGGAGAFAKSRKSIADALPGVAIAVALVPPLSVIGIGLSQNSQSVTVGASLLFLTNLIGIIFSGGLVFLWQRYGSLSKAKNGLALSVLMLILLGLPLGFSLQRLIVKEQVRRSVEKLLRRETITFGKTDIRELNVEPKGEFLLVDLEVSAPGDSISEKQVKLVRKFLESELQKAITLNVQVIPVTRFEASSS